MSDPLAWSINLGRWGGTTVRVHPLLWLFAAFALLGAALAKTPHVAPTAGWLTLLIVALAVHELGHALAATWQGIAPEEVRLWPLGSLTGHGSMAQDRTPEGLWVAFAGPATSLFVSLAVAVGLGLFGVHAQFNPFGLAGSGTPILSNGQPAAVFSLIWWFGWFGYLNWVIFLANLIPAPPLDGGRMLRGFLAGPWGRPREQLVLGYVVHASAIALGLVGLVRLLRYNDHPGASSLIVLAVFVEVMLRAEARMIGEGGADDDETFLGYDFSQGYTSLESGSPAVRPRREGALARWRRRRDAVRRRRQAAESAAEERRMDELLDKIYREGRESLSPDDRRFLDRVSAKYRERHRAHE